MFFRTLGLARVSVESPMRLYQRCREASGFASVFFWTFIFLCKRRRFFLAKIGVWYFAALYIWPWLLLLLFPPCSGDEVYRGETMCIVFVYLLVQWIVKAMAFRWCKRCIRQGSFFSFFGLGIRDFGCFNQRTSCFLHGLDKQ